jgi:hypothetical protein
VVIESYQGQSEDELVALLQDDDVEVVEHAEYPNPSGMSMPGPMPRTAPTQAPGSRTYGAPGAHAA